VSRARERSGTYAGCAWLTVAAVLAVGAYWGLGIAGPSALPAVLVLVALAVGAVVLAAAMWFEVGGARLALLSSGLGAALAVLAFVQPTADGPVDLTSRVGAALFGVAIVLSSLYASWVRRRLGRLVRGEIRQ